MKLKPSTGLLDNDLKRIITIIILVPVIFSCSTPLQDLTYMNQIETGKNFEKNNFPDSYRIRPNDQLFIQVISDDPMNVAFLNLISTEGLSYASNSMELVTYLVDEGGIISYPQLGKLHVAGFTVNEIRDSLQRRVDGYVGNTSVFVKHVNRTLTILGEVGRPGQQPMAKNQLTIFEAIGSAGDITDFGNRKNVKLIRETNEGTFVASVDLTNPDIIYSPHYYILPHDVIYVEPAREVFGAKTMPYTTPFSLVATVISTALLVLNILK
jgi:polysaccharide export outer membrane protein